MSYKEAFNEWASEFFDEHGRDPTEEETQDWYSNLVDTVRNEY